MTEKSINICTGLSASVHSAALLWFPAHTDSLLIIVAGWKQKNTHPIRMCDSFSSSPASPASRSYLSGSLDVSMCPDRSISLRGHIQSWYWARPSHYTHSHKPIVQETIGGERSPSLGEQRYSSERARASARPVRLEWHPSRAVLYPLITQVDSSQGASHTGSSLTPLPGLFKTSEVAPAAWLREAESLTFKLGFTFLM